MPEFNTRADFQKLVDTQLEETLTLEYKASPALARESTPILELCKDVSAMANSAGGQIIYGIEEDRKTHKPARVDDGVADQKITREWLHQILSSRIQPRIDGVQIQRIPLSERGNGYVITVPQTMNGPHQAPDKKYYKRFELEAKAMEDYEIRDILRRSTTPDLELQLSFLGNEFMWKPEFKPSQELSEPFFLDCSIVNHSPTPVYHAIIEVWVDHDLHPAFSLPPFKQTRIISNDKGQDFRVYQRTIASPPGVPVFMEAVHESHVAQLPLQLPARLLEGSFIYFETVVQAPGCSKKEFWYIECRNGQMALRRRLDVYAA